jgi:hypothetical protein
MNSPGIRDPPFPIRMMAAHQPGSARPAASKVGPARAQLRSHPGGPRPPGRARAEPVRARVYGCQCSTSTGITVIFAGRAAAGDARRAGPPGTRTVRHPGPVTGDRADSATPASESAGPRRLGVGPTARPVVSTILLQHFGVGLPNCKCQRLAAGPAWAELFFL